MSRNRQVEGLNTPQREAVEHVDGPLLILAGAGSGKTRVITRRIVRLIRQHAVSAREILALTFTNKAADEMRNRVDDLLTEEDPSLASASWISTFHSFSAKVLRFRASYLGRSSSFLIYDDSDQRALIRTVSAQVGLGSDRADIMQIKAYIERAKNRGLGCEAAFEAAHDPQQERLASAYECYEGRLRSCNAFDFGGLILGLLEIFRNHPEVAQVYGQRWRHVMVDEFQDTNPAQYELLGHLTSSHRNLVVVGDDDQAIYRWRGATVENLLDFDRDYPDAKVICLEQNYRSSARILNAANDVIRHADRRREKRLWTDCGDGEGLGYFEARDDGEESAHVAREIGRLRADGVFYSEMAVFYRTNAQSRVFEEYFRGAGIPYRLVGGLSFYAREEVRDLLAYLRLMLNPASEIDLLRVINKPRRGIGDRTVEKLQAAAFTGGIGLWALLSGLGKGEPSDSERGAVEGGLSIRGATRAGLVQFVLFIEEMRRSVEELGSLAEVVRAMIDGLGYVEALRGDPIDVERKRRNIGEFISALEDFDRDFIGTSALSSESVDSTLAGPLQTFLERSSLVEHISSTSADDAVTLMTVHAAKGLEFSRVFLVGMEEDLFPGHRALADPDELDEERRLAYVAITRAKAGLSISSARRRRVFGTWKDRQPSRFVLEISPSRWSGARPTPAGSLSASRRSQHRRGFEEKPPARSAAYGVSAAPGEFFDQRWSGEESDLIAGASPEEDTPFGDIDLGAGRGEVSGPRDCVTGSTVSHARFGIGTVVSATGTGDRAVVSVEFVDGRVKKVVRRFLKFLA
jgi:DNA helicase II / ATP-dependent DNA helicase PcrA